MAENRHSSLQPQLLEISRKFLFYMCFIKSASPETLRSYRSDLTQAFQLNPGTLELPTEDQAPPKKTSNKLPKLSDDELLQACRSALHQWTHLAPASRNRKAACLKSLLNWLLDEGCIERDLAAQIHSPKVPQRLPHHLSVDEVLALLESTRRDLAGAASAESARATSRELALILLLYGGGLRISEACSLEWNRVDLKKRSLRVKGKGGQERIVVLPPMVLAALDPLPRSGPYVFGNEPLSTRSAYEIVRSRGVRAGLLKPLHPHALRHSYATHLLSSGANLRTLQELLGHRTLQATQRYTHIGIDQLARTMENCHPLGQTPKNRRR